MTNSNIFTQNSQIIPSTEKINVLLLDLHNNSSIPKVSQQNNNLNLDFLLHKLTTELSKVLDSKIESKWNEINIKDKKPKDITNCNEKNNNIISTDTIFNDKKRNLYINIKKILRAENYIHIMETHLNNITTQKCLN